MSKMDALRAMREARYAETQARVAAAPTRQPKAAAPVRPDAPAKAAKAPAKTAGAATEATDELCGHRNMSGRTCTRELGHSAKNHRYSATGS